VVAPVNAFLTVGFSVRARKKTHDEFESQFIVAPAV
jgi:hypothetical protein